MMHPILARVADFFVVTFWGFTLLVVPQLIEKVA